jgi:hypothetical protein
MARNQHVVQRDTGWAVRKEGSGRDTVVCDTQAKAIAIGRKMAMNQGAELVIHGRQGQIREKNSFGRDPYPPKATPVKKSLHLLKQQNGKWSVRRSGTVRPTKTFPRKAEAVSYAKTFAKKNFSGLYIHKKDGSITGYKSFARGSHSPKNQ